MVWHLVINYATSLKGEKSRVQSNGLSKRFNKNAEHGDKETLLCASSAHYNQFWVLTVANNMGRVLKAAGCTILEFSERLWGSRLLEEHFPKWVVLHSSLHLLLLRLWVPRKYRFKEKLGLKPKLPTVAVGSGK